MPPFNNSGKKNYHSFIEREWIRKAECMKLTKNKYKMDFLQRLGCPDVENTNRQGKSQKCTIRNIYCKCKRIYSVIVKI